MKRIAFVLSFLWLVGGVSAQIDPTYINAQRNDGEVLITQDSFLTYFNLGSFLQDSLGVPYDNLANGSILVGSPSGGITSYPLQFYYSNADKLLGVGTSSPEAGIHIANNRVSLAKFARTSSDSAFFELVNNVQTYYFQINTDGSFEIKQGSNRPFKIGDDVEFNAPVVFKDTIRSYDGSTGVTGHVWTIAANGKAEWADPGTLTNDDQKLDTATITNDTLYLSLTGDGEPAKEIDLTPYSNVADDQAIEQFDISNDSLRLKLENSAQARVDLEAFKQDSQSLYVAGDSLGITRGNKIDMNDLKTSQEEIEDIVGGMVSGNTETGITVDYDDPTGKLNFDVAGGGTDDQTVDTFELSGTDLRLSLEGDNEAFKVVDLSGLGGGTDDQVIDTLDLNGTSLEISLEGDAQAIRTLDLSPLQDGTGTDDQTLNLVGTDLSIESGNTVDLSTIQDGTGTDDQNLDVGTFNIGTGDLTIGIEDGTDQVVNLDGRYLETEVDGSVTNEIQTIDTLRLVGTTLEASLLNDAEAKKTIDLSSLQDGTGTDDQNITGSSFTTGTGDLVIGIENGTNQTVNLDGRYLQSEVDGSITNEGSLSVGAGTSSTSLIQSNTSGSPSITIEAGANMTISESGNTITLAASGGAGGGGDVYKSGAPVNDEVAIWTNDSTIEGSSNLTFDGDRLFTNQINIGNGAGSFQIGGATGGTWEVPYINASGFPLWGNPTTLVNNSSGTIISAKLDEADGDITNEGALTVLAGSPNTSIISSNTSGSTDITLLEGANIELTEAGNVITIAATGGGTDDQTIDTFRIVGTDLELSLEGDAEAKKVVDLSVIQDGTGTDDQDLTLTGNILAIENDPNSDVDLSPYLDNTERTDEEIEDVAGAMFTGNTETLITATYQDIDGTVDLVVEDDLSLYDNTTSGFLTTEVDGSITNEGSLSVGAGTSTTSLIQSNTSGSPDITIEAGTGITLAESGNTITITGQSGSDDQKVDTLQLTGTTLELSLEDDAQALRTVDLSSLQDGTGTDDQNITGSSFTSGTGDLVIGIENGTNQTVNLDGRYLQSEVDGSITNELQDFDLTNLSGTDLQLSLTQDPTTHTVDLSSLQDGKLSVGTDNQVPFTNAGGTDVEYDAKFIFDGNMLTVGGTDAALDATYNINSLDNKSLKAQNTGTAGASGGAGITAFHNNGVTQSSGDRLGFSLFGGYNGTNVRNSAGIIAYATETWNGTTQGSELVVEVSQSGAGNTRESVATFDGTDGLTMGSGFDVIVGNTTLSNTGLSSTSGDLGLTSFTGTVDMGNYAFDSDQSVGVGQDNYVLKYDNTSGLISLEADETGGGGTDDQNLDVGTFNTGTGDLTIGIEDGTDQTVNLDGRYLQSEVDGSISNEGSLSVGAGTSTTALIQSNTSGSPDITIEAGANITISESGNTITLSASGGGGGGGVYKSGTPVNEQVGVWINDSTLYGSSNFTFDGSTLYANDFETDNGIEFVDGATNKADIYFDLTPGDLIYRNNTAASSHVFTNSVGTSLFEIHTGTNEVTVQNELRVNGDFLDNGGGAGTAGQVPISNGSGSGFAWGTISSTDDQNLDVGTFSTGTGDLTIGIEDGTDQTINLDGRYIVDVVDDTTPELGGDLDLGGFKFTETFTAGATITSGDFCTIDTDAGDGRVYETDADDETRASGYVFYATEAGTAGNPIKVVTEGIIGGWVGLTAGAIYWLDPVTGKMSPTKPSTTGQIVRKIGQAISTTQLYFKPDETWVEVP